MVSTLNVVKAVPLRAPEVEEVCGTEVFELGSGELEPLPL